jgi:hypothetical protein
MDASPWRSRNPPVAPNSRTPPHSDTERPVKHPFLLHPNNKVVAVVVGEKRRQREENKEPTVSDSLSYATALPSVGTNDVDHHQIIIISQRTGLYIEILFLEYSRNENRKENACQLSIRL